MHFDFSF